MGSIADELMKTAKPYFQVHRPLTASCPKCGAQLALMYAAKPKHGRKLSVIIACSLECDRAIWGTEAEEGFTHWWLDGPRDRLGYEKIVVSLPPSEKREIHELEDSLRRINATITEG